MADKLKRLTYYKNKTAGAAVDDKVEVIPANTTWSIKMIDFTARAGDGGKICVYWNGTANTNIRACSQGDKSVVFPGGLGLNGNGSRELVIRLDNTDGATASWMGCVIYYEELG